jgi:hypothetical protein
VRPNGLTRDVELLADLVVREALREPAKDVALAVGDAGST